MSYESATPGLRDWTTQDSAAAEIAAGELFADLTTADLASVTGGQATLNGSAAQSEKTIKGFNSYLPEVDEEFLETGQAQLGAQLCRLAVARR